MAHHESKIASTVLNIHTNMKGLAGPSQLTRLKLKMRMSTPTISKVRTYFRMKVLIMDMGNLTGTSLTKYTRLRLD
jgi:hypothetical protein